MNFILIFSILTKYNLNIQIEFNLSLFNHVPYKIMFSFIYVSLAMFSKNH
jgi:hypothetical protein